MTEREQFEAWLKTKGASNMKRNGIYVESMTRLWEECWQAARAQPAQAEAVPPDVEVVRKALDRAFTMGQNYWADADSESIRANKRSDVTRAKFLEMREEVCAVIAAQGTKT